MTKTTFVYISPSCYDKSINVYKLMSRIVCIFLSGIALLPPRSNFLSLISKKNNSNLPLVSGKKIPLGGIGLQERWRDKKSLSRIIYWQFANKYDPREWYLISVHLYNIPDWQFANKYDPREWYLISPPLQYS